MATEAFDASFGQLEALPAVIADAASALPDVAAECRGANDRDRATILLRLANLVGKTEVLRNGSDREQQQYFADFHAILGHLPAKVLERACLAYAAAPEGEFMPKPGKLLALASTDEEWREMTRLWRGLERLSLARPAKAKPDDAEEAEVSAKFAALLKRLKVREAEDRRDVDAEAQQALEYFKRKAQSGRMTRLPEGAA